MTEETIPATARFDGEHFIGHEPNEGCEHHTVGNHRAWCLDCTEWCYPTMPCVRCERAVAEAAAVPALPPADARLTVANAEAIVALMNEMDIEAEVFKGYDPSAHRAPDEVWGIKTAVPVAIGFAAATLGIEFAFVPRAFSINLQLAYYSTEQHEEPS